MLLPLPLGKVWVSAYLWLSSVDSPALLLLDIICHAWFHGIARPIGQTPRETWITQSTIKNQYYCSLQFSEVLNSRMWYFRLTLMMKERIRTLGIKSLPTGSPVHVTLDSQIYQLPSRMDIEVLLDIYLCLMGINSFQLIDFLSNVRKCT